MASRIEQATELFNRLAADLVGFRPDLQDRVLCPLCVRSFGRDAIGKRDEDGLSIEHIIPRALGGAYVTLTCRRCNNQHGSAVDAHFIRMIRAMDWQTGDGSELKGNLRVGNDELPIKISWGGGKNPTVMKIPGGKPEVLEQVQRTIRGMKEEDTFDLDVNFNYVATKAKRGLIRVAYLVLFDVFGYSYILGGAGKTLRNVIREGSIEDLKSFAFRITNVNEERVENPVVFAPVGDETGTLAYLVIIRIDAAQKTYHAVLMPVPDTPEDQVLNRLVEIGKKLHGHRYTIQIHER